MLFTIKKLLKNRKTLFELSKNDLRARFAASFLGVIWAYVQPLVTILVLWYVFQVGFRSAPIQDVPFILWFAPAYLVWYFFNDCLLNTSNCLLEYSYLVKKVNFQVGMIPLVKVFSALFIHLGFIALIFIMNIVYGVHLTIYSLQVFYYLFCVLILLTGLGWLLSALAPFIRDTSNIVNVILQIGFWLTPIFWNSDTVSDGVKRLLSWNPMYYICQGYRDCFISHVWFWERGTINLHFWLWAIVILFIGINAFTRLRPYFVDEL